MRSLMKMVSVREIKLRYCKDGHCHIILLVAVAFFNSDSKKKCISSHNKCVR